MEGGTYTDEAEARGRAIIALDVLRRTETHAKADGGMLVPMVLAVVEPAIIMARRVPTTAATCVR